MKTLPVIEFKTPIIARIAARLRAAGRPKEPVAYDPETTVLTLADGTTILLEGHSGGEEHYPYNLFQAIGWHNAILAGQPVTPIRREVVVEQELAKISRGLSPARREALLAYAAELDGEEWTDHWRRQSARGGARAH
ncbi:MAG: hypothetical protein H0T76_06005 [Nannocystis sp.]|nr:hypothetical protein [Nannocystis sp.]MBA3546014.1 hypothetical protein [Nannocystis sp.]